MMNWESWDSFFEMGGYALYVWGSLLVSIGFIAGELIILRLRRKATKANLMSSTLKDNDFSY